MSSRVPALVVAVLALAAAACSGSDTGTGSPAHTGGSTLEAEVPATTAAEPAPDTPAATTTAD
ncbi:MAG: hypothetical protein F4217_07570, partial [Acidimicrobiaceae bacterium]|nr:hypothetical protein [Acidimicrobiaceae bacterium]